LSVVEVLKRVSRIGKSLSIILPSSMARSLGIESSTVLYAYAEGGRIVYSLNPPDKPVPFIVVKPRVQSRYRNIRYYALTIPSLLAKELGIREGDSVSIRCGEGRIYVSKGE